MSAEKTKDKVAQSGFFPPPLKNKLKPSLIQGIINKTRSGISILGTGARILFVMTLLVQSKYPISSTAAIATMLVKFNVPIALDVWWIVLASAGIAIVS